MSQNAPVPGRLLSLDAFRGLAIAGMILVNTGAGYAPLEHAEWNGLTIADLMFPFFVFIVGVSLAFSFGHRGSPSRPYGVVDGRTFWKIARRSLLLYLLGVFLWDWNDGNFLTGMPLISAFALLITGVTFLPLATRLGLVTKVPTWAVMATRSIGYLIVAYAIFVLMFGWTGTHFGTFLHGSGSVRGFRALGVLHHIAICYFVGSILLITTSWRTQLGVALGCLAGYWLAMMFVPFSGHVSGDLSVQGNLAAFIDRALLHPTHMYTDKYDPEGILSTVPAVATLLFGLLTGQWLRGTREPYEKVVVLFAFGMLGMALAYIGNFFFPVNKALWSPPFVLVTAGMGLQLFAFCYWMIDIRGIKRWAMPLIVFGSNAIAAYVLADLVPGILVSIDTWRHNPNGTPQSVWRAMREVLFSSWIPQPAAHFAFALTFVGFCWVAMWVLFRRRIYIRI